MIEFLSGEEPKRVDVFDLQNGEHIEIHSADPRGDHLLVLRSFPFTSMPL
ncbi:hypothetical protein ACH4SK_31515 [Streptomyces inhibens]